MRQKYLVLMLAILLFTIAGADATNNISEVVGPFEISFSLPNDVNATVEKATENGKLFYGEEYTSYLVNLRASLTPTHLTAIDVTQHENGADNLINLGRSLSKTMEKLGYINVTSVYKEIDGCPGLLLAGSPTLDLPEIHGFVYLFDDQTSVVVSSTFPWDSGTSMMLETLHVEKVE